MAEPLVVNLRDFRHPKSRGGFDLPPDVVRIDRATRWGNPFVIGQRWFSGPMTRAEAIEAYGLRLVDRLIAEPAFLEPLRGKRLACWCAPTPCHGDVILEILDRG